MKRIKITSAIVIFLIMSASCFAQGINYKALIKDGDGNILENTSVTVRFTVLQGVGEANVYQETHTTTTDVNGIIIINIGEGTVDSGVFGDIDWAGDIHALKTELDIGSGLVDMGTSQFKTVPYALTAANAATKIDELSDGRATDGDTSVYLGKDSGINDDASDNQNTGFGYEALKGNTTGFWNASLGYLALTANTTGFKNTGFGHEALTNTTEGWNNTAMGHRALLENTTGNCNTAFGSVALRSNTTGIYNTAIGNRAMFNNTTGYNNLANGYAALSQNSSGYENTANGSGALFHNTTGYWNTSNGYESMYFNTGGNNNAANGYHALYNNTTGNFNTASGFSALSNNTTGSNNTALGYNAQVPDGAQSNQVRIGNTNVTYAGVQVAWTVTSDKTWKKDIRELPYGLDMVLQLKPVDYVRKNNADKTREIGFIAQDVEALLKKLGYDDQGILTKDSNGNMSLRYNDFIALLTKAVQEQQAIIDNQKKEIETLSAELEDSEAQQKDFDKRLKAIEALLKAGQS